MVLLLSERLGIFSLKFPFKLEKNDHQNSEALSASLDDFRSKTSNSLSHIVLEHGDGFRSCFEVVHGTHRAFAKLVSEINYPVAQWGGKATGEYLDYSMSMLGLLNSVSSSVSHVNQAKIAILHGLTLVEHSPTSARKYIEKIPKGNAGKGFGLEGSNSSGVAIRPGSDQKECVILEALITLKRIGFFVLGFVLSGLGNEVGIKEVPGGGGDDPLEKLLESRLWMEKGETEGPMDEVNRAIDGLYLTGGCDEAVRVLKGKLEAMEKFIHGIEEQANVLFSGILATRNMVLHNIGHNL